MKSIFIKSFPAVLMAAFVLFVMGCGSSSGNLAADGSANCYIISKPGTYYFPTVSGNSKRSVGSVASVDVLWESFGTRMVPNKGDIIESVSFSAASNGSKDDAGTITFSTPATLKNGNAVIAAKDEFGEILWSWHIWVCNGYDPIATSQEYYNNAGTMMDRNLGATSATPGDVGALGLLYQWGRKDPFLGGCQISYGSSYYSEFDQAKAASTLGEWPSHVSSNSSTGTIAYAVAHPTTFISRNDDSNYNGDNGDWYHTEGSGYTESSNYTGPDNTRWQSSKTIYDPCPPGWRVPDGGSCGLWSRALGYNNEYRYCYDETNEGVNFSGIFGSASIIWYPAAGWLYGDSGSLSSVGCYCNWWSCTPDGDEAYCNVGTASNQRAFGFSVRCQKESPDAGRVSASRPVRQESVASVRKDDAPYSVPVEVFTTVYPTSDDGFVNVRSEPSSSAKILTELRDGLEFVAFDGILLEKGQSWSKVEVNGIVGWCNNRYLGYGTWYEGNGGPTLVSKKDNTPIYGDDLQPNGERLKKRPVIAYVRKGLILADKFIKDGDYYVLVSVKEPMFFLASDVYVR